MNDIKSIISSRLRSARKAKGLTQGELAAYLTNITQSAYAHIENGRNMITVENLIEISSVLEVSPCFLLGIDVPGLTSEEAEIIELWRQLPEDELVHKYGRSQLESYVGAVRRYNSNTD